jgi:hypothetical protein
VEESGAIAVWSENGVPHLAARALRQIGINLYVTEVGENGGEEILLER